MQLSYIFGVTVQRDYKKDDKGELIIEVIAARLSLVEQRAVVGTGTFRKVLMNFSLVKAQRCIKRGI